MKQSIFNRAAYLQNPRGASLEGTGKWGAHAKRGGETQFLRVCDRKGRPTGILQIRHSPTGSALIELVILVSFFVSGMLAVAYLLHRTLERFAEVVKWP